MRQNSGSAVTIGLMGNSGCGKSTVSLYLKEKGAFIIDADRIAHSLIKPGEKCYNDIREEFGSGILNDDTTIDRKKLGDVVFNNRAKLERLNEISHKAIVDEILRLRAEKLKDGKISLIVIDAPLLTETGLHRVCDRVWLVFAEYEKRIERIMKRDSITREKTEERFKNQTDFKELKKYADEIIDNSADDTSKVFEKIDALLAELQQSTKSEQKQGCC